MATTKPAGRSAETTRQRILEAALARFARASYEEVGLRDIAADVGVDVALVHRSFGSKERLFAEAFRAAVQAERLLAADTPDLPAVFARDIFERGADPQSRHADALCLFVRSLASPAARAALRGFVDSDFIAPLAARLGREGQERAALLLACVAGISLLRDVLEVEPLLDGSRGRTEPLIERILGACLAAGPDRPPGPRGLTASGPQTISTAPHRSGD